MIDGLGEHHWGTEYLKSIEDVCLRVTSGGTPSRRNPSYYEDGRCPWLKTKELRDGWLDDAEEHITDQAIASSSAKLLPANTVLMAMYGATVGQLGILRLPMACNQACCAMIVDADKADYRYLFYQLLHARPRIKSLSTGAAQQNLSSRLIRSLRFAFPSLSEQRAISRILGTLDDKIELTRRMNDTLEAIAWALFKSWFVDFDPVRAKMEGRDTRLPQRIADLFPDRLVASEIGEIPEGWGHEAIHHFADIVYGAPFASKQFNTDNEGVPLIRIRDLATHNPSVSTRQVHQKGHLINPGDIVVGMDGEFRLQIWKGPTSWLNQRVCHFEPRSGVPISFLLGALREPLAFFERGKVGTTVIHLGKRDLDTIRLLQPSQEILNTLAEIGEPLLEKAVTNSREIRILTALRDALLPKLISGEIRVPDAEKVVESVT